MGINGYKRYRAMTYYHVTRICNSKVEDSSGIRVVYCPLPFGHTGEHTPDPATLRQPIKGRCCQAVSPDGVQCGMPELHGNLRHSNGLLDGMRGWSGDHRKKEPIPFTGTNISLDKSKSMP